MPRYVDEKEGTLESLPCATATFTQLRAGGSPLAQRILTLLAERPRYSHDLAKELRVHEQKVYYHVRKLERARLIVEERRQEIKGASAKYYRLASPAFAVLLGRPTPTPKITAVAERHERFLRPFIANGKADFLIVVGSPEAHGPQMARAKDGVYALDLALFLGTFLAEQPQPVVKLDTEFTAEDWRRNLIVIGGPIVNTVAGKVNGGLPVRFEEDGKTIRSTLTHQRYATDEIGVIVKAENPRAKGKALLFIAGRRGAGTKAAIIAFLHHFDELIKGNAKRPEVMARVVEGKDLDSDGVVDEVRFRE
jgi:DNA-binding transcriptional ArsR family regulator